MLTLKSLDPGLGKKTGKAQESQQGFLPISQSHTHIFPKWAGKETSRKEKELSLQLISEETEYVPTS